MNLLLVCYLVQQSDISDWRGCGAWIRDRVSELLFRDYIQNLGL
jgi:hypothetical protein